jgi:membrane protease YdiL (CAAX protease family)
VTPEPAIEPSAAAAPAPVCPGRPWGLWATFGLTLAVMAATLFVAIIVGIIVMLAGHLLGLKGLTSLDESELSSNGFFMSLIFLASAPAGVGLIVFFAWLRRKQYTLRDYLGLRKPRGAAVAGWLGACLALVAATDGITYLLGRPIVPEFMETTYRTSLFPPLLFLAIVAIYPLFEEFLFRGFLFEGIRRSRLGAAGAILISTVAWALGHTQYDWYGVLVICVGGILLGAARLRTNCLWICILMHATSNLIATIEVAVKVHFFD